MRGGIGVTPQYYALMPAPPCQRSAPATPLATSATPPCAGVVWKLSLQLLGLMRVDEARTSTTSRPSASAAIRTRFQTGATACLVACQDQCRARCKKLILEPLEFRRLLVSFPLPAGQMER